jgi:hypothetical protein
MLQYGLCKNDHEEKRTKQRSKKFSRLVLIIGILLLLNICYVSAVNSTDVKNLPPPQTLNVTTILPPQTQRTADIPLPQTLNVTSIPTTLVPNTTLITAVQTAVTSADPTQIVRTLSARDALDQYTLRESQKVTQEEKEAAAADYKKTREAFLLQGNTAPPDAGGVRIAAAFNGTVGPTLDPGGIPHYFGPYPNWANSPMPMGSIASITVDDGGRFYTGTPTITIADAYFTGSGNIRWSLL